MPERKEITTNRELAQWYDNKYKEMGGPWKTSVEDCLWHLQHITAVSGSLGGLTFLDVGCGSGDFLKTLWGMFHPSCIGIDFSTEACKFSAEACPEAVIINGSVNDALAYLQPGIFDWIVSIGTVEHFVDQTACYLSMARVLKPRGHFYFYAPNELWTHEDQPNERTFTDPGWMKYWKEYGFIVQGWERLRDNTAFWGMVG